MATTEQSEEKSTESLLDTFKDLMKKSAGLKLATQAQTIQSLGRNLLSEDQWVDRTKAAAHKSIYGEEFPTMSTEDEEMHVGDDNSTRNIYYPAQPQGSTAGTLAKLALGAGLLASGVGVPIGGYIIAEALKNQPVPAIDTDTDTQYEIGLEP